MSVMTSGKPGRLTRAAHPARRQAVDRGQPAAPPRHGGRRVKGQPGARPVRHLHAVPDVVRIPRPRAVPGGRDGAATQVRPTAPGARQPGETGRPGGAGHAGGSRGIRRAGRMRDARPAPPRSAVRLTRRGRVVVAAALTAVALLLVALAWMAVAARAQAADSGPPPNAVYQNLTSVVVHPGQTLWAIAAQAEPAADPRVVMQEIIDLNALRGSSIEPGQRLWVPHG